MVASIVVAALIAGSTAVGTSGETRAAPVADTIVYCHDGLFTVRTDGTHRRQIVAEPACGAEWSPDGRRIAYEGDHGIFVATSDGKGRRRLTNPGRQEDEPDTEPSWSPDGKRIVFHREFYTDPDTLVADLYTVDVRTARVSRLTRTPGDWEWSPSWSPDGRRIAFVSYQGGATTRPSGVYALDVATHRIRRVLRDDRAQAVDFSPDGRSVVYSWAGVDQGGIVVVDIDGSHRREIVRFPDSNVSGGAWAPDGTRIALVRERKSGDTYRLSVMIVRLSGTGLQTLVEGFAPDWKPRSR